MLTKLAFKVALAAANCAKKADMPKSYYDERRKRMKKNVREGKLVPPKGKAFKRLFDLHNSKKMSDIEKADDIIDNALVTKKKDPF